MRNKAALVPDTNGRQPEARGRYASQLVFGRRVPDVAAIPDHARRGIGLLPKIEEVRVFQFLKEQIVTVRKRRFGSLAGMYHALSAYRPFVSQIQPFNSEIQAGKRKTDAQASQPR
jgi:hypothetical protein